MICDGSSCRDKYIDEQIYNRSPYDTDEDDFIISIKHMKCKVIQLVRRQIRKFNDTEYNLSSSLDEWQTNRVQELKGSSYNMMQTANVTENAAKETNITSGTVFIRRSTMPSRQAWILHISKKIRQRICMIILIAVVITLMASMYGIYFRAYLCNNGKSCVTSLRYTQVKHALF